MTVNALWMVHLPDGQNKYISDIKDKCKSEKEVQRRVYGKFVRDEG